jgi:hypothetical protein
LSVQPTSIPQSASEVAILPMVKIQGWKWSLLGVRLRPNILYFH